MAHIKIADRAVHHHVVSLVFADLAIEQIHVAHKVRHETAVRVLVNVIGRAHLQQTAFAHHCNSVGHGHGFVLVMRDHDTGHTHLLDDVDQLDLGLLAQFFVQRAQGFIEHQQLRALGQAARQGHALLLAA